MTNKEAIEVLTTKLNIAYFTDEDNEALDLAIKALEQPEVKDDYKILKRMNRDTVTYNVGYLLDNLAREVYLLESYRKWKEQKNEQMGNISL